MIFFFESEFSNVDNVFNISRILIVRIVILNGIFQRFCLNHKLQNLPKKMFPLRFLEFASKGPLASPLLFNSTGL